MRFMPGKVSLSDIGSGTLAAGTVPLPRVLRNRYRNTNGGVVTITAATADLLLLDCGSVTAGDFIMLWVFLYGTKGATAGDVYCILNQESGTATIDIIDGVSYWQLVHETCPANGNTSFAFGVPIEVTGSGTLVLRCRGQSAGSNTTVNAGNLHLYALQYAGS